jgi:hypothetical protein
MTASTSNVGKAAGMSPPAAFLVMKGLAMTDIIAPSDSEGNDPFDLRALREPQTLIQVRRQRLVVSTRKSPHRRKFVRVHPSEEYRVNMPLYRERSDIGDEEAYFVRPEILDRLQGESRLHTIYTAVTHLGGVFLWFVPFPLDTGRRPNDAVVSNRAAAEVAMQKWVRVAWDETQGAYQTIEPDVALPDPVWPKESFLELLKLGFQDRIIDRPDHPVILRLRGHV